MDWSSINIDNKSIRQSTSLVEIAEDDETHLKKTIKQRWVKKTFGRAIHA